MKTKVICLTEQGREIVQQGRAQIFNHLFPDGAPGGVEFVCGMKINNPGRLREEVSSAKEVIIAVSIPEMNACPFIGGDRLKEFMGRLETDSARTSWQQAVEFVLK